MVGCAAVLAAFGGRGRAAAANGLASIALTSPVVNLVLKPIGDRRRPDRQMVEVPLARQVAMPRSSSWPSGHSASAFAFATGVGAAWPAAGVPLSALASLVAYSRVHTGVHYPSDTIAGAVTGVALAPVAVAGLRRRLAAGGSHERLRALSAAPRAGRLALLRSPSMSQSGHPADSGIRGAAAGLVAGALAIAVVTLVIAALQDVMEPAALTGLYLLAIRSRRDRLGLLAGRHRRPRLVSRVRVLLPAAPPQLRDRRPRGGRGAADRARHGVRRERARAARACPRPGGRRALAGGPGGRAAQRRLADEQAALRRVATLVAQGLPTDEIFEAVTREVGLLCDADMARMERFEPDRCRDGDRGMGTWRPRPRSAVGTGFALEGASIAVQVRETGTAGAHRLVRRRDGPDRARGAGARHSRVRRLPDHGRRPAVGRHRRVDDAPEPFPADTEARVGDFTELVATAISNAEARADLIASRERLLTAGDEARRRVVRDLHDGAQQRFVHTILTLELALRAFEQRRRGR